MSEIIVQIGDSFRNTPVITIKGDKRHIMFVIAENETELLIVPMDSFPDLRVQKPVRQAGDMELNVGDYSYGYIRHRSYVNYKRAEIVSKNNVENLIKADEIDLLDPISDEFLIDLIENAKKSKFIPKKCKEFLLANPWI